MRVDAFEFEEECVDERQRVRRGRFGELQVAIKTLSTTKNAKETCEIRDQYNHKNIVRMLAYTKEEVVLRSGPQLTYHHIIMELYEQSLGQYLLQPGRERLISSFETVDLTTI